MEEFLSVALTAFFGAITTIIFISPLLLWRWYQRSKKQGDNKEEVRLEAYEKLKQRVEQEREQEPDNSKWAE